MKETRTLCDICDKDITDDPYEVGLYYNRDKRVFYDLCKKHKEIFDIQFSMHIIAWLNNERKIKTGESFGDRAVRRQKC